MILMTGFEPFNNRVANSSELLVNSFRGIPDLDTHILPVVHKKCFASLVKKLQERSYSHVLLIGESSQTDRIDLEKVARNFCDYKVKDNEGNILKNSQIIENGEDELYSTLNLSRILKIDSELIQVSNSAGTFVCNELFYRTQDLLIDSKTKSGFIHIPSFLKENTDNFDLIKTTFSRIISNIKESND